MKNKYSKYSDSDLLSLIREQKPICDNAFYEIFQRYAAKINAYCKFRINNSTVSDEIFQETWTKFNLALKNNQSINNVPAYLITIAKNLIYDYLSSKNKNTTISIEEIDFEIEANPFDTYRNNEQKEIIDLLNSAINNLDDKYKEAIILKKIDNLSYTEIAQLTGESQDCIKKRVVRAMQQIKVLLEPYIKEVL